MKLQITNTLCRAALVGCLLGFAAHYVLQYMREIDALVFKF